MCLAIYRKAGGVVTRSQLRQGWSTNKDGGGFCFLKTDKSHPDGQKLAIYKGYVSFKSFYKALRHHDKGQDMLIHLRMGNVGLLNMENTHPHRVSANLAFIHNGTITNAPHDKGGRSDTVMFNEEVIKVLRGKWWQNAGIMEMMSTYCAGSKLVFMHTNGTVFFVNENLGHWDKAKLVWYSNHGYEKTTFKHYTWNGTYGKTTYSAGRITAYAWEKPTVDDKFTEDISGREEYTDWGDYVKKRGTVKGLLELPQCECGQDLVNKAEITAKECFDCQVAALSREDETIV